MPSSPVDTWSIQDVQVYLDELGLGNLKAIFLKNGVDGKDLSSFTKSDLTQELGATELQARKILTDIESRKNTASTQSTMGYPAQSTAPVQQQNVPVVTTHMVTPAPVVATQGPYQYQYYQRERYVGGITWVIAILFCFPCIFCCPVDERQPVAQMTVVTTQPTNPPQAQQVTR
ncbi:WD repeat, SAM and U-box domain-containing protein 1 [Picochlorum sp. SENEW3]|nr:WD repeat, SAM and U-box domain-containing protein 1 [Picochlorum sp. SENEW3]